MVTTAADLLAQTKDDYLVTGLQEQRNKLAAPYTAGSGSLTFQFDLGKISQGAVLSLGQNTFYVWTADATTKTAIVQGGYQDSTDAHADAGDVVTVAPRYPDARIFRALNQELAALSSPRTGLFQVKAVDLPWVSANNGYDLTGVTSVNSIIEVRYDLPYTGRSPRLGPGAWRLERNAASTSGFSLKVFESTGGQNLTVLYRAPFDPFTDLTSDLTDVGLPDSMVDLLSMGAALRLLVGREIRRNDLNAQGDTRRPEEVPAGAAAASWRGLAALRAQRIAEEAARLSAQYPVMR